MSTWTDDFKRRLAEPLGDEWPVALQRNDNGDPYERRKMVAKRDIAKGEVLLREKPLLCIARAMVIKIGAELDDPKVKRWVGGWVLADEDMLYHALQTDDPMFEYIFEKIVREHSELFRDHEWMDEFLMNGLGSFRPEMKKTQIRLVRSLAERGMRDCVTGARKFISLFVTNSFMCHTVFGAARYGLTVFHYASNFNHSCVPNAVFWHNRQQEFVAVAAKPIAAGEEVCIAYTLAAVEVGCRHTEIPAHASFTCRCVMCADGNKERLTSGYNSANDEALVDWYTFIIEHGDDPMTVAECWFPLRRLMQSSGLKEFFTKTDARSLVQFARLVTHLFERRASNTSDREPFLGLGFRLGIILNDAFLDHFQRGEPFLVSCRGSCVLQMMWLSLMEQFVKRGRPTGRDSATEALVFQVATKICQMYDVSYEIAYDMIEQSSAICGFNISIDVVRAVTMF